MKIAAIVNAYPSQTNYSDFTYVHTRLKYYIKEGNDVHVFSRSREKDEKYVLEGVMVFKIKSGKKIAVQMINDYRPDVMVVHAPHTWSLAVAEKVNFKKASWIHGSEALELVKHDYLNKPNWLSVSLLFLYDRFKFIRLKRFLLKNQAVVYVSEWMKKTCEGNIKTSIASSYVLTNPIDLNLFTAEDQDIEKKKVVRKGIALRGFSTPKYGLDIAIKAFSNFQVSRLTIIGTGALRTSLEELIEKYNSNVELIHKSIDHKHVPGLLRDYDYFVSPSRTEAQGAAMCEAMACGLPVIATNVGGIPEFVKDNINGYLVPPESPEELRKAIIKMNNLTHDQFVRMCRAARDTILTMCDIKTVCDEELSILSLLMRN